MKNFLLYFVCILFLTSCTGGLYSHYPKSSRVKSAPQKEVKASPQRQILLPENIPAKFPRTQVQPIKEVVYLETNPPQKVTKPSTTVGKENIAQDTVKKLKKKKKKIVKQANNDTKEKGKTEASISLLFSLLGWFSVLASIFIPGLGLYFFSTTLILEVIALTLGIIALNKKSDNTATNVMAIAGIVLSALYLLTILLVIGLVIVFILALL